jgi:hypothetical protein
VLANHAGVSLLYLPDIFRRLCGPFDTPLPNGRTPFDLIITSRRENLYRS